MDSDDSLNFCNHPAIKNLREFFTLDILCGYIVLLKLYNCSTCLSPKQNSNSSLAEKGNEKLDMINDEDNIDYLLVLNSTNNKTKNFNSPIAKDPR